jgi:glycosyltransferase involved in cell wall biosynthesis
VNVLFVCNEYPPSRHGGIGTFVKTLASALVASGHRVYVVGVYPGIEANECVVQDGVEVHRLPSRTIRVQAGRYRLSATWLIDHMLLSREVARLCRARRIDVVESHDWSGPLWWKPPVPTVVRLHGAHTANATYEGVRVSRLTALTERRTVAMADKLVAVSRHIGQVTLEALGLQRPFDVIYNGVDTDLFHPPGADRCDGRVLYVGSVTRRKGLYALFSALPRVFDHVPTATVSVVGRMPEGDAGTALRDGLLADLPPHARRAVSFAGVVPHGELPAIYGAASVCVVPSFAEAFGLTCAEAMACGTPVVMTALASGPEMVENGQSGLLADPNQPDQIAAAIRMALGDRDLRDRLGRGARARALGMFDARSLLSANISVYASLSNGAPSVAR